ncbi:hypothetical protein JFK97_00020 [Chromobacterium phragmitis]|uniref:lipopolysaccharide biosynthesis protein n=1 Tax=Chromobacterium amazonense TaxID=1382803 RepID=UPI0021B72348|nr:hypothetical protein [Chromobacterium amazonense]MBM2882780.1 hypothetical protein [Chromobacterium amazonense]MDE1715555.1 hypothetical protein [Chromobacterium amazonense]
MRGILTIATGDVFSKFLLVAINLMLIRSLSVHDYAHFTILTTVAYLGYQMVCGPLERLYIAEHAKYKEHLTSIKNTLLLLCLLLSGIWLWKTSTALDIFLCWVGIIVLTHHQYLKIHFQKKEDFTVYSLMEICKNFGWLLLAAIPFIFKIQINEAYYFEALIFSALVTILIFGRVRQIFPLKIPEKGELFSSAIALKKANFVIGYTLAGAAIPYYPVFVAVYTSEPYVTSLYGAASRYLAILNMAAFAFNTVLLPQLASVNKVEECWSIIKRLAKKLPIFIFCYLLVIVVVYLGMPFVDKGKYSELPIIFLLMSITPFLSLISAPFINILLLNNGSRLIFLTMLSALVLSIAMIPLMNKVFPFQYIPAVGSIITYLLIAFICIFGAINMKDIYSKNSDQSVNENVRDENSTY